MLNRTSKLTALMVAAASAASMATPVLAAEKLTTVDGTITNAIAFDGTFIFDGYRTDDDDSALYFNNGKDKEIDEDEDYSYDNIAKYGSKYVTIKDGNEDFLVDLSTGKILDDESVQDKEDNVSTKLRTALKKTDRYGKAVSIDSLEQINEGRFGDIWYKYTATTGAGAEYSGNHNPVGFVNESGKYIDVAQTANLYVYNGAGRTVKISEYNKEKDGVEVSFVEAEAIAQDKDYIYTVTTVDVKLKDGKSTQQTFLQKISKAQGEKKDGAYLPKSVTSYQVDSKIYADGDVTTAANLLVDKKDGKYSVVENGYQVKNGNLYVTTVNDAGDSVKVYTIKLKKSKIDTTDKNYKNVDTYVAIKDDDNDQDIVSSDSYAIDSEGTTWALDKGKLYKFTGSKFELVYTCDRSLDRLDVYNEGNLVIWEEDGDVFASVNKGKSSSDEDNKDEDKNEEVVKAGWEKNADGTWSYYNNGAKATGWLNLNGTWYYLDANGIMKTGWLNLNGTWYYLESSGAMKTGWLNLNGTWYYLQSSGAMKTGWLNDNGTWYYLNASGAMLSNTTVGGYRLGANGAWIR